MKFQLKILCRFWKNNQILYSCYNPVVLRSQTIKKRSLLPLPFVAWNSSVILKSLPRFSKKENYSPLECFITS